MLIVLGYELTYFVKHETKGIKGDAENDHQYVGVPYG
jgi:hypothetical protein